MPSNHLILCLPLFLLSSIFPSVRVFSNESVLCTRWPKYGSFNFSISPSSEYSGVISFRIDWLDLLAAQGTLKSLLQHHSSNNYLVSADCFQNSMLTNIQKGKCSCRWDGSDFSIYALLGNTHKNCLHQRPSCLQVPQWAQAYRYCSTRNELQWPTLMARWKQCLRVNRANCQNIHSSYSAKKSANNSLLCKPIQELKGDDRE